MKLNSTIFILSIIGLIFTASPNVYAKDNSTMPVNELRLFSQVYSSLKTNFIDELDDKEMISHCLTGMVNGIDPDSEYLEPESFQELKIGSNKFIASIGVVLAMGEVYPKVITSIESTPADRMGLKNGDFIIRVNEIDVQGYKLIEVVNLLRGKPETIVNLKIRRHGEENLISFDIKREIIRVQSVKNKLLENKIGYVRISNFHSSTGRKLKQKLKKLISQAGGRLKGLILDLRNNPGGLLDQAIAVADTFLDNGMITYTENRSSQSSELKFMAKPGDMIAGVPLIVLVNEGSAAASEIVAGALKDHKRATIIGKRTYGRGSIQTIIPLLNGGALKLTTSRWRTPAGAFIHRRGIDPDIMVNEHEIDMDYPMKKALVILQKVN